MSGAKTEWRAGRPGDLVRAVTDDRSAAVVEGVLRLNLVGELGYVKVMVETHGRWPVVAPSTVVVLRAGPGDTEGVTESLGAAEEAGLLPAEWSQPGGSWEEMDNRLDGYILPLVQRGWEVVDRDRGVSGEHGDSVLADLRRGDEGIEIELYGYGHVMAWSLAETDEDTSPPLWATPSVGPDDLESYFRASGWL